MITILFTILCSILITLFFLLIPNKSNITDLFMIPLLACIILKFCIGDWDYGSKYSWSDILFFVTIILASILTIKILKINNN